jgi:hypothetical protein
VARVLSIHVSSVQHILKERNISVKSSQEISRQQRSKPVAQIDLQTGKVIHIYPSYMEAERNHGNTKHIASVCAGKRKSCAGYGWKYLHDIQIT